MPVYIQSIYNGIIGNHLVLTFIGEEINIDWFWAFGVLSRLGQSGFDLIAEMLLGWYSGVDI